MGIRRLSIGLLAAPALIIGMAPAGSATESATEVPSNEAGGASTVETTSVDPADVSDEDTLGEVEMHIGSDGQSFEFHTEGDATIDISGDEAKVYGPEDTLVETLPSELSDEEGNTVPLTYSAGGDGVVIASFADNGASGQTVGTTSSGGDRSAECYLAGAGILVGNVAMVGGVLTGPGWFAVAAAGQGINAAAYAMSC